MKRLLLGSLCCIYTQLLWAQAPMWSNQGATVSVENNTTLSVQGDVLNEQTGVFQNQGAIYVTGNWENNASNEAFLSVGAGEVYLHGDNQLVEGISITRFYELYLRNTGLKEAAIDVYVDQLLDLGDRTFAIDTHTVHVFNPGLNAMQHSVQTGGLWGMVSSEGDGGLLRYTNSVGSYLFPVGGLQGTARFRPVALRPEDNNLAAYKVRMANVDATIEGWDRNQRALELCLINPLFYHRISRMQGNTNATTTVFYDQVADGTYNSLGQWQTQGQWDLASATNGGFNATYNLNLQRSNQVITDFSPNPFALTESSSPVSLTANPNPVCANEIALLTASTTGNPYSNYDFYVDTFWVQSGNNDTYNLSNMRTGQIPVWVVGSNADCGARSDTVLLTVHPAVNATLSADTTIIAGTNATLTATGGDFYLWWPDSALNCDICPTVLANPDQSIRYWVEVENMDGCKDTASVLVSVQQAVADLLFIPNVLTPNNDGFNDTWLIKNIAAFPENRVQIVNRWGDVVFQSSNYQNDWDGQYSGGPLPAGTYYYILELGGSWGVFKGDVTIIRE